MPDRGGGPVFYKHSGFSGTVGGVRGVVCGWDGRESEGEGAGGVCADVGG